MRKIKLAGIYIIEIGEYYYIGKSVDIMSRWSSHYGDLYLKKHHSVRLQELYDEIGGITNLNFKVLEYVSITDFKKEKAIKGKELTLSFSKYLLLKEREWMSKYSIKNCLNTDNKYFIKD